MKQRFFLRGLFAAIAALVWLGAVGCSAPRSDVAPAWTSTIQLTGNAAGCRLIIDDRLSFDVSAANRPTQFRVEPGEHRIRIERNGAAILERTISTGSGETVTITVP